MVEMFAGCAAVQRGFVVNNFVGCVPYDYLNDSHWEDFGSMAGWLTSLALCLRLVVLGLCWWAPDCSSWIWVSRSCNLRHAGDALGHPGNTKVLWANQMVSRMAACLILLDLKLCVWLVEQPGSTVLHLHPRIQTRIAAGRVFRRRLSLSKFGSSSLKPTVSSAEQLQYLTLCACAVCVCVCVCVTLWM
jgi:hypothetical protein